MKRGYWKKRLHHQDNAPRVHAQAYDRRYNTLLREGFFWHEAYWLAQHTINTPAARLMRQDRRLEREKARSEKLPYSDWRIRIRQRYIANGWLFNRGTLNPFKYMDSFKTDDDKVPNTPQPKRKRSDKQYEHSSRKTQKKKVSRRGFVTGRDKHLL